MMQTNMRNTKRVDTRRRTAIIAHRGASGYLPEHSLASYLLAIDIGTDYIEPDLVLSKDGTFFALHDLLLDDVTNIKDFPEYQNRTTTRTVEGYSFTGYFVSDFTAKELKRLRLKQRLPDTRSTLFDGEFEIPLLTEIFDLVRDKKSTSGKKMGIYPELKHPLYYQDLGFNMEDKLLKALTDNGYAIKGMDPSLFNYIAPVVIQCFIPETLISLRKKCDLPLLQLQELLSNQTISDVWNTKNLDYISTYANGVGPSLTFFTDKSLDYEAAQKMMDQATERKLIVHPYVLRADQEMMAASRFLGNSTRETYFFTCCLNIDGIFSDYSDRTRQAVEATYRDPNICADICPSKFMEKENKGKGPKSAFFSSNDRVSASSRSLLMTSSVGNEMMITWPSLLVLSSILLLFLTPALFLLMKLFGRKK